MRDTGCGMDAATKARIFEPFFTTKPVGKGTGLGLATVFGIVKQGGGLLDVESSPGNGTAFRVFWPGMTAAECAATPATPVILAAPPSQLTQGSKTVLLVDDENDIRELATLTLEEHGYRVLTAANAEEALLLGEKHGREIDALVTDVMMPGISGVQLAELLTKRLPGPARPLRLRPQQRVDLRRDAPRDQLLVFAKALPRPRPHRQSRRSPRHLLRRAPRRADHGNLPLPPRLHRPPGRPV